MPRKKRPPPTPLRLLDFAESEVRLRGKPFSLAGHAYLEEIYAATEVATPRRMVFMKAAQLGLSTYHLVRAAWLARRAAAKTLYFLPTDVMARLFARDHLPALVGAKPWHAAAAYVPVGEGVVMFRGLLADAGVRAQDADFIVLDEMDCASPERVALAEDRILHSELALASYLSTPTLPGAGIARLYDASDQRRWLVRCACGWKGDLLEHFPACVGRINGVAARLCPGCGGPLRVVDAGWEARAPGAGRAVGYQLSHLWSRLDAETLLAQFEAARRPYEVQRFYNSVLGKPYIPDGVSLSPEEIARASGGYKMAATAAATFAGVDVGDDIHACFAESRGGVLLVVACVVAPSFEDLARAFVSYGVVRAVVDAMPYKSSVLALATAFPGKVTLAYFSDAAYHPGFEKYPGGYVAKINLERTAALDRMVTFIRDGRLTLPDGRYPVMAEVARHLASLRRTVVERRDGSHVARWLAAGPDHFALALTYLVAAYDLAPAPGGLAPAVAERRRF